VCGASHHLTGMTAHDPMIAREEDHVISSKTCLGMYARICSGNLQLSGSSTPTLPDYLTDNPTLITRKPLNT
jgi:hypothetical protein